MSINSDDLGYLLGALDAIVQDVANGIVTVPGTAQFAKYGYASGSTLANKLTLAKAHQDDMRKGRK